MMKLWMILWTANTIGGTWGPLPYDMAECMDRKAAGEAEFAAIIESKKPGSEKLVGWDLECRFSGVRPALGERRP
jgi:hypothetical protein